MATKQATKKTAGKPASKKSSGGKSMTVFEQRMAEMAAIAAKTEEGVGGGSFLGTKGGVLTYQGAEVPGNEMDVVILDHIIEYTYYGDEYDSDNPTPPLAFAFGREESEMRWHENSVEEIDGEPIRGELCKDSSINQFGSAERGKGKATKNIRRLAIIPADQLDDIENAEVAYVKVPVTSVKGWAGYVRQLATGVNRPPLGVVTRISLQRDDKTMFKMRFEMIELIEDAEQFEALIKKSEQVATEIDFPYQPTSEEDERPQRGRGKPARKAGRKVPQQTARQQRPQSKPQPQPQRAVPAKAGKGGGKPAKAAPSKAAPAKARKY